jgi:hypothetical protein
MDQTREAKPVPNHYIQLPEDTSGIRLDTPVLSVNLASVQKRLA